MPWGENGIETRSFDHQDETDPGGQRVQMVQKNEAHPTVCRAWVYLENRPRYRGGHRNESDQIGNLKIGPPKTARTRGPTSGIGAEKHGGPNGMHGLGLA